MSVPVDHRCSDQVARRGAGNGTMSRLQSTRERQNSQCSPSSISVHRRWNREAGTCGAIPGTVLVAGSQMPSYPFAR